MSDSVIVPSSVRVAKEPQFGKEDFTLLTVLYNYLSIFGLSYFPILVSRRKFGSDCVGSGQCFPFTIHHSRTWEGQ